MPLDSDATLDLEGLTRQQARLSRQGRLHWVHWTIVGASVLITVVAWYLSSSLVEQRARQRFELEITRVVELVDERMRHYEDALLSGVASIQATGGEATRAQWRRYAENLRLAERYPGIDGIGVIHHVGGEDLVRYLDERRRERPGVGFSIHPEHDFDFYLPIAYIEPEGPNARAIGLDVAFERNRRDAALEARLSGATRISGPIVLVQDADETPGFLFYAPYYDEGGGQPFASDVSTAERETRFRGFVYAPLIVESLVAGTLDQASRDIVFSIRDGDELLYEESNDVGRADDMPYAGTHEVELYGRTWTFDFRGAAAGSGAVEVNQPLVVLISGLAIDTMLFGLFALMSRSNRRVLSLARTMTGDLSRQAVALEQSNKELTAYAHVVSHDLKTPLRGIQDLADFVMEDLSGYLASPEANPEVGENLDRLTHEASRAQALITGILQYASVGMADEGISEVDVGTLLGKIGESLGVGSDQLVVEGPLPTFETHALSLEQVLSNLIDNAFKYSDDPEHAVTRVSVDRLDDFYRFSVTDDGPGIEPRFHETVFEAFKKLHSRQDVISSGIGLSIVKKSVELLGGSISIRSVMAPEPGHGTTFLFDWPVGASRPA